MDDSLAETNQLKQSNC